MDEYHKPYEYEEIKVGGFLFVFFIMLISLEILLGLFLTVQFYTSVRSIPIINITVLTFSIIYMLSILFTAISLFIFKKNAITISKSFLIFRLIFLTISSIIIFTYSLHEKLSGYSLLGRRQTTTNLIIDLLVFPITYICIFSLSWYAYFVRSKKVKMTYTDSK